MTEERFEELVNLYLDNEIGRRDLGELKGAVKSNGVLRRRFEHSCQLHQAARKALSDRMEGNSVDGQAHASGQRTSAQKPQLTRGFSYPQHRRQPSTSTGSARAAETAAKATGNESGTSRHNKSISAKVSGATGEKSFMESINPLVGVLAGTIILATATFYVINYTNVVEGDDNRFAPTGKYNPKLSDEDAKFNFASAGLTPDGRPLESHEAEGNISTSVFGTTIMSDGSVTQIVHLSAPTQAAGAPEAPGGRSADGLPISTELVSVDVSEPDSIQWSAGKKPPPILTFATSYQNSSAASPLPPLPAVSDVKSNGNNAGSAGPNAATQP